MIKITKDLLIKIFDKVIELLKDTSNNTITENQTDFNIFLDQNDCVYRRLCFENNNNSTIIPINNIYYLRRIIRQANIHEFFEKQIKNMSTNGISVNSNKSKGYVHEKC